MKMPRFSILRWLAGVGAGAVLLPGCGLFGYERLDLSGAPIAAHCSNLVLDGDELAVDCGGGTCPACEVESTCSAASDCSSSVCVDSACQTSSCADGVQNQDESGVDCGGTCAACAGAACVNAADCGSSVCIGSACRAASCTDGVLNQDETSVDCGGPQCAACSTPPTCFDGVLNQDEAGVDCGGSQCGVCPSPACSDGVLNQDETGVDCGGSQCGPCPSPSCSDGILNQDETGTDCGGSTCAACGSNTPPLARMLVTPGIGSSNGTPTLFQGDASASSDLQDAPGALSYSWDWDNDGVVDATGLTSTHTYPVAGTYEARLGVQDSGGLSATTTFLVIVTSASDLVLVTTAIDENDSGATPGTPQGTGLSLREAISYSNATAGKQSILVPAGFSIALSSQLPNPTDAAGVDIVGDGAVWDGTGMGPADDCIQPTAPTRIFGFEIRNCRRSPLRLAFGAGDSQFSRLNIHDNSQPVFLNDTNVLFGPDNEVSHSAGHCVSVVGQSDTIAWNYIHDCATRGIDLTGSSDGALVIGNVITASNPGIFFGAGSNSSVLVHNVVHANLGDGVWVGSFSDTGIELQNNILSSNAGYGLRATDSVFAVNDHNDYFGNVQGTCTSCSSLGPASLESDPLYLSPASDDYRLQLSSPNVNAGIDTGQDVNGPEPGNGLFSGSNPDIGARESP
jgi:PKD repeat protein